MENPVLWIVAIAAVLVVGFLVASRKNIRTKPVPDNIRPGQPLPQFQAVDEYGDRLSSSDLAGAPAILLFVRGSWCPFCSKQVADLTKVYKEITDAGAKLILLTPKPLRRPAGSPRSLASSSISGWMNHWKSHSSLESCSKQGCRTNNARNTVKIPCGRLRWSSTRTVLSGLPRYRGSWWIGLIPKNSCRS